MYTSRRRYDMEFHYVECHFVNNKREFQKTEKQLQHPRVLVSNVYSCIYILYT